MESHNGWNGTPLDPPLFWLDNTNPRHPITARAKWPVAFDSRFLLIPRVANWLIVRSISQKGPNKK
jgi:hypothetical protein